MNLEQLYVWSYDGEEPFEPETKHLSCNFLASEIAEDITRKAYQSNVFAVGDLLDNLYIKLIDLNISLDKFLDLIYLSQKADVDKYLFTMYGMNSWLFDEYAGIYEKNPKFLKKLGLTKIPLYLDPVETSNATDFFTLLNINNLKKSLELLDFTQKQKEGLIEFFNDVKKKAQFEYRNFDIDLANGFKPEDSFKALYQSLIKSCDKQMFKEVVDEVIAILDYENNAVENGEEEKKNLPAVRKEQRSVEACLNGVTFENIEKISSFIVGQKNAVRRVTERLMASAIGLRDPNKALCSLLLDGPTGIGKTEMAKAIAKACFDGRIHVEDMSEYKHESDLSRLTGASAGFVGYGDTPAIVNFLTNNDSGVILFDEIDKCNPKCLDILMRMIDEGEFQTAKGNMLSTKNMVIVCTTNMSEYVEHKTVGFNTEPVKDGKHALELATSGKIRKEILGRFDEIVKFEKLTKEECSEIALRYLISHAAKFNFNHKQDKVQLIPTPQFIEDVIEDSNYKVFGGRNVRAVARKFFDLTVVGYYKEHKIVRDKTLVVLGRGKIQAYTPKQFKELKQKTKAEQNDKTE